MKGLDGDGGVNYVEGFLRLALVVGMIRPGRAPVLDFSLNEIADRLQCLKESGALG